MTGSTRSIQALLDYLDTQGAIELSHGAGRTLRDHLHGTMKILCRWRQPKDIIAAGLLHSIYGTDVYRRQLASLDQRKRVRQIAGPSAERLVYLFGSIRRTSLFESLERAQGTDWTALAVNLHRGGESIRISKSDAVSLLTVYMANTGEQARRSNGEPGLWLAAVSQWGEWIKPHTSRVPPLFSNCSERVRLEDEQFAGTLYAEGLEMIGQHRREARLKFAAARSRVPWIAEPAILLGFAAALDGRWRDAFRHASNGQAALRTLGTAWDKRLSYEDWESAAEGLIHCAETGFENPRAAQSLAEVAREQPEWRDSLRTLAGASSPSAIPERFLSYISRFDENDGEPKRRFYPRLRTALTFPPTDFPLAAALSHSWKEIRKEFLAIQPGQGFQNEVENIKRTGNWTTFMLFEMGRRNVANCARCPTTTAIVEKYGATGSVSSAIYFSILSARTHVAAHTGPTNMRVRCHLGIEVPEKCRLRVGDQMLTWREGECLVFDDSFSHEVWNDSDKRRVVLVVDLWHPDLSSREQGLLEGLQRYAYAHSQSLSPYWLQNERARQAYRNSADRLRRSRPAD